MPRASTTLRSREKAKTTFSTCGAICATALAVPLRRLRRRIVALGVVGVDGPRLPRVAVRGQEVRRHAIDQRADLRIAGGVVVLLRAEQPPQIPDEQLVARVGDRTVGEELLQAARHGAQRVLQRRGRAAAHDFSGQVGGSSGEEAVQRVPGDETALEKRRQPFPRPRDPELGEDDRHVRVLPGEAGENPQRSIQRGFDEPRHLGLVRHLEAGIEIRLEGKLTEERQAERVDGADRDVRQPIAHVRPPRLVELRPGRRVFQLADDALAHLRRRLPRERNREDVAGIDARLQQVHVAPDEHRRLSGSGRRFEHDVVARIDREVPRARVGIRLSAACFRLPATRFLLPADRFQLPAARCQLPASSFTLLALRFRRSGDIGLRGRRGVGPEQR